MNDNKLEEIINDIRAKAKRAHEGKQLWCDAGKPVNHYDPGLVGVYLDGVAAMLEKLVEHGLYITPKAAPDAPEKKRNADRFRKFLTVKWLGIEFRRFKSNAETLYVATWRNDETRDSHVYEIRVKRDGYSGWIALAKNDGRCVFALSANSRANCEKCALSAMKRYLSLGHKKTYRKRRAATANKEEA